MDSYISVVVSNENRNVTVEQTVDAIVKAGFKHVFCQWYDASHVCVSQSDQIKLCRKNGLHVEFVHLGYKDLSQIWEEEGGYYVDQYKKDLKELHDLDIDLVVMHARAGAITPDPNELGLNRFKEIVEYAKSLNIKVALENTRGKEHFQYLLDNIKLDNFGICFDAGHYHCCYQDDLDISKYKDRVFCVHLHDNFGEKDQHLLPFDGDNNWHKVIQVLHEVNYHGPITMELCYKHDYEKLGIEKFYEEGYRRGEELFNMFNENNLNVVAGGTRREKTITISVPLMETKEEKEIDVYVDGLIDSSLTTTLNGLVTLTTIRVKGTSGNSEVTIRINGLFYKKYTVDFETGNYSEV